MFNFTSKIILSPKLQDLEKLQWLLHLRKTGCRPEANRKCGINDDTNRIFCHILLPRGRPAINIINK